MATIRNRNGRWHVQIRKANARSLSRTFTYRKDAELWVRESEREIELGSCVRRSCGIGWKVGWHKY